MNVVGTTSKESIGVMRDRLSFTESKNPFEEAIEVTERVGGEENVVRKWLDGCNFADCG